ncbi:uncharacterized protein [Branchiostoma lanceolatum]|uniref:uncharacterized protein isoform X2 n=1 Tax=Branchiostoma lanceolatum TaxID=7740 RepID=UPI0011331F9A
MKAAVVLVCLAVLVAIVHSAPSKREVAKKAVSELKTIGKKVSHDHKLVNDPKVRAELKKIRNEAGHLSAGKRASAGKKIAKTMGKKNAQNVLAMMHGHGHKK